MARRIISILMCLSFIFQQTGFAQAATVELNLAGHLARLNNSLTLATFRPVHLRYFSYDLHSNNFKVLLDKGSEKNLSQAKLENSTKELLKYFLIGVTLPDNTFWVNLRPDSPDQIIEDVLTKTDIGKIMLETDLQLKKDTAAFTSPQTIEGKEYWDNLYKKAEELYGTDTVTIPTITRPWIVPNEVIVREAEGSAYIYKATLKVMLEADYIKSSNSHLNTVDYSFKDKRSKALNEYSTQLIRELIIPKLTKEVNTSKNYASLRQVFYSLILSRWFKLRFAGKTGTYPSLIDKQDLTNLTSTQSWDKSTYFNAYKESFAEGEYNIKETHYTPTGQVIRSYFSGGVQMVKIAPNGPGGLRDMSRMLGDTLVPGEGAGFGVALSPVTVKSGSPVALTKSTRFATGYEPTNIANLPSEIEAHITRRLASIAAAILTATGLRGAALNAGFDDPKADKKAAKKQFVVPADSLAKIIYAMLVKEAGIILVIRSSEGERDEIAERFNAAQLIIPDELRGEEKAIMDAIKNGSGTYASAGKGKAYYITKDANIDVIEGTNATVFNVMGKSLNELTDSESGGTSYIVTGPGVQSLGNVPDHYAYQIITRVNPENATKFQAEENNPLDPELIAENPQYIRTVLSEIAKANGISINDIEVVIMDRKRETENLAVLRQMQQENPGLVVTTIKDGTFAHGLVAAMGRKEGKHKVMMTVGGATEAFANLAIASAFKNEGAVATVRILSKNTQTNADGSEAADMANRYAFGSKELTQYSQLRPEDGPAITEGKKLFTLADVKGNINASVSFITHNGVFGVEGVEETGEGSKLTVLRIGTISGQPCAWFERRFIPLARYRDFIIPTLERELEFVDDAMKAKVTETIAQLRLKFPAAASSAVVTSSKPIGMDQSRQFYKEIMKQGDVIVLGMNMRNPVNMRGVFRAAKETGAPVIIQRSISEFVDNYLPADLAWDANIAAAQEGFTGSWMLKLDHATASEDTPEAIAKVVKFVEMAKEAGFGSYAIDCSKLVDFSKPTVSQQQRRNYEVSAEIVKKTGIEDSAWEGEIGEIVGDHKALSTVEEAIAFGEGIEKQGVRPPVLMAINNGSEHGNVPGMKIDLEGTKKINDALSSRWGIFINQHGITGTKLPLFPKLAEVGIRNGNIGTHWQNIVWNVVNKMQPEIAELAKEALELTDLTDKSQKKVWDKKVRYQDQELMNLLKPETEEAIIQAVYESAKEHFEVTKAKSVDMASSAVSIEKQLTGILKSGLTLERIEQHIKNIGIEGKYGRTVKDWYNEYEMPGQVDFGAVTLKPYVQIFQNGDSENLITVHFRNEKGYQECIIEFPRHYPEGEEMRLFFPGALEKETGPDHFKAGIDVETTKEQIMQVLTGVASWALKSRIITPILIERLKKEILSELLSQVRNPATHDPLEQSISTWLKEYTEGKTEEYLKYTIYLLMEYQKQISDTHIMDSDSGRKESWLDESYADDIRNWKTLAIAYGIDTTIVEAAFNFYKIVKSTIRSDKLLSDLVTYPARFGNPYRRIIDGLNSAYKKVFASSALAGQARTTSSALVLDEKRLSPLGLYEAIAKMLDSFESARLYFYSEDDCIHEIKIRLASFNEKDANIIRDYFLIQGSKEDWRIRFQYGKYEQLRDEILKAAQEPNNEFGLDPEYVKAWIFASEVFDEKYTFERPSEWTPNVVSKEFGSITFERKMGDDPDSHFERHFSAIVERENISPELAKKARSLITGEDRSELRTQFKIMPLWKLPYATPSMSGKSPAASSAIVGVEKTGGIDFKNQAMASVTAYKPMGSFVGLDAKLPQMSAAALAKFDLDKVASHIESMLSAKILFDETIIMEYMAASIAKGELAKRKSDVVTWLAKLGMLQEELDCCQESSPQYRQALVLVEKYAAI